MMVLIRTIADSTRCLMPLALAALLLVQPSQVAEADVPEIANVHPDFMGAHDHLRQSPHRHGVMRHSPQIITGENFDAQSLDIRVWSPPDSDDEDAMLEALRRRPVGSEPTLPAEPPDDARPVRPVDVDGQVIVAVLTDWRERRAVVWIGNEHGYSEPYLYNVARPFWVSDDELAPGELLRVFGYGLRREYRENWFALKNGDEVILLHDYGRRRESARRVPFYISYDTRLLETHLPSDLATGDYEVYVHNGWGGEFGWRKAGDLRVREPEHRSEQVFDVRRDFGAVGDGRTDDTDAIEDAIAAAAEAGGGTVYLAPGTYMVNRSLRLPGGVMLKGASRENTRIEGFGYEPGERGGRRMWNSPADVPASVILMESHSRLERLGVRGSVMHGGGGNGLVETIAAIAEMVFPGGGVVEHVTLREVDLHAPTFQPEFGNPGPRFYSAAFSTGPTFARRPTRHIQILNSTILGDVEFGSAERADLIGNTIRQGAIFAGRLFDSLISENIMKDDPYRFFAYRTHRTYFRSNELYNFGNRRVHGASESFMIHGGSTKTGGRPTGADDDTLTDADQHWSPGQFQGSPSVVLITAGRGFGQYRRVVDNTQDTLILERPWNVIPDETSEYAVGEFSIDSVFYDNYNDGLGRMTLWLDCINIVVENHRANMDGGIDIWGSDRSAEGSAGRYMPSWYNMLLGNDMEGSRLYLHDNQAADNLWAGPTLFANYIVSNNIVNPVHRNVRQNTYPTPAINTGIDAYQNRPEPLERDIARNMYTMLINNTIAQSTVGIRVPKGVRKNFVLRNDFMDVEHPIIDHGSGTVIDESNRIRFIDPETGHLSEQLIPDAVSDDPLAGESREPRDVTGRADDPDRPFQRPAEGLRRIIPSFTYLRQDIQSEPYQDACQANLEALYEQLEAYNASHGHLPEATFYPTRPFDDADSIHVLLGEAAAEHLQCPSAGPDFAALGWTNYIWNEAVSGRDLREIDDRGQTWLLMDFAAPHPWLIENRYAGHRGGINILFADGSVRWLAADEVRERYGFSW